LTGAAVSGPTLAAPSENPSFLALHPNGRVLYAVNEVGDFGGRETGAVSAFAVDPETGALSLLDVQPSEGADPCHLAVDSGGRNLVVANYTSGSVAVFPIAADGSLRPASSVRQLTGSGPNKARQAGPHAHGVFFDPSKKFILTADLGSDRILVERYDATVGTLEPNEPGAATLEPGSGPRHLAFHPDGKTVYVLSELSGTVSSLAWDAPRGVLSPFQRISSLPPGFSGANTAAEIAVSPDGRFVYASNRGDDAISVFAVGDGGRLAFAGRVATGGRTPRHFAIDPSGRWLVAANQNSSSIVVFRLDPATGLPRRVGGVIVIPEPVCILFAGSR
jgi:6-phosphogluconolactonase